MQAKARRLVTDHTSPIALSLITTWHILYLFSVYPLHPTTVHKPYKSRCFVLFLLTSQRLGPCLQCSRHSKENAQSSWMRQRKLQKNRWEPAGRITGVGSSLLSCEAERCRSKQNLGRDSILGWCIGERGSGVRGLVDKDRPCRECCSDSPTGKCPY